MSVVTLPTYDPLGGVLSAGERLGGWVQRTAGSLTGGAQAVESLLDSLQRIARGGMPGAQAPDMPDPTTLAGQFSAGGRIPPVKGTTLAVLAAGAAAVVLL